MEPWRTDAARIQRGFDSVADGFDAHAFLHDRLREALLARLDFVQLDPRLIIDAGCATGRAASALARRYPRARVLAVDFAPRMVQAAARGRPWRLRRRIGAICADVARLPLPDASVDLLFSNLLLPWTFDPLPVFAEWRRVLRPGGLLTFTSVGPDTLRELRTAFAAVDACPHVNGFIDMHDLGDAMVRAGLAEPVMDAEVLTVTYPNLDGLWADLRATTPGNTMAGRRRGLMSPRALARLRRAYAARAEDAQIGATVEAVFGHAWRGVDRRTGGAQPAEVRVPVAALRRTRPT